MHLSHEHASLSKQDACPGSGLFFILLHLGCHLLHLLGEGFHLLHVNFHFTIYFTPIINAPEVAIMGVCKSQIEPKWDGTVFQPRLMLPLSLSWDHRVIDGAAAARFNAYFGQVLGDFRRVLL